MPRSCMQAGSLQGATVASMAVGTTYYPISEAFVDPAAMVEIINNSDTDVFVFFGNSGTVLTGHVLITDWNIFVPAHSGREYDFNTNAELPGGLSPYSRGTIVYATSTNPGGGSGSVYCSYFYQGDVA